MTQPEAAARAGVSLATWRRWEEDPDKVKPDTQAACESVLNRGRSVHQKLAADHAKFERAWGANPDLTPRQAYGLAAALQWWADACIDEWLKDPSYEPLHQVSPFDDLDLRVMMLVGENRAWATMASQHCISLADGIRNGYLSFFDPDARPCFFDELVVLLAVPWALNQMVDMPDFFDGIPPRLEVLTGEEDCQLDNEDDWRHLMSVFEDEVVREDWESVLPGCVPSLRDLKKNNHPFSWFDAP